jgi:hypothetical protein
MFTEVNARAARAASEKRRMTSVSQSTLVWSFFSFVRLLLQDSTDDGDGGEPTRRKGDKCHKLRAYAFLEMNGMLTFGNY